MSAEPSAELLFGKYRLIGVMNSGGMAELFLAQQAGLEGFTKVVALKRILPHLAQSPDFVQMFLDEARLAARLDHPNIVRIYDFGEVNGQYFLAMEYLPGEDLSRIHHMLRRTGNKAPVDLAAAIVQAAAEGLHFAHQLTDSGGKPLGLVHRDANPANIIVTYQGTVKVVDFGVAKAVSNVSQTQAGQVKGKSAYLAPEQATGEPDIDRRADVFCLGIVLWETLTGKKLFARENDTASAQAVVSSPVPPPNKLRPDIPPELDAITLRALAKNPDQRFQTAGELADEIETYFHGRGFHSSPKNLTTWMEELFGKPRADAKRSIAQGRNLRTSISVVMKSLPTNSDDSVARLAAMAGVSPLSGKGRLSSSPGTHGGVTSPGGPPSSVARRVAGAVALLAGAFALMVAGHFISKSLAGTPTAAAERRPATTATLTLESDPDGAFIFIGGEPTGQFTPSTLQGLSAADPISVRLEKEGYEAVRDTVQLEPGQTVTRRLVLEPLYGRVRLERLPAGAQVVVDGKADSAEGDSLELSPGKHVLEIKVAGQIITRTIEVKPGAQTVSIE
jgi:serine/threonine protein kinase